MIQILDIDCMEYMKGLDDNAFDLAIVDPPYFDGPNKSGYYGKGFSSLGVQRAKHYSEIECWSSCTTGEHWGPMVYLSHGSVMWYGNCGSAYGVQDDLHNNWIFHDVMVEGKSFGESAGKYYWLFDRDFTTLDPTTLYGRSSFFQGGLTNVKAIFGDPALTCYSPDWIEPVPVIP